MSEDVAHSQQKIKMFGSDLYEDTKEDQVDIETSLKNSLERSSHREPIFREVSSRWSSKRSSTAKKMTQSGSAKGIRCRERSNKSQNSKSYNKHPQKDKFDAKLKKLRQQRTCSRKSCDSNLSHSRLSVSNYQSKSKSRLQKCASSMNRNDKLSINVKPNKKKQQAKKQNRRRLGSTKTGSQASTLRILNVGIGNGSMGNIRTYDSKAQNTIQDGVVENQTSLFDLHHAGNENHAPLRVPTPNQDSNEEYQPDLRRGTGTF